jgi:hypothetical protein
MKAAFSPEPVHAATRGSEETMLIIIVLLAFLSGVYVGGRFFAGTKVE